MDKELKVLDKGFVRLVDCLASDSLVVQAARCSTVEDIKNSVKSEYDNKRLIRYLIRNNHGSPLEMPTFIFHIKMPIFVLRQWERYRTASAAFELGSKNEYSLRYSKAICDFHIPDSFRRQDNVTNKQGSAGKIETDSGGIPDILDRLYEENHDVYEFLLGCGVAREQAREVLPVANYTQFYWKNDLRNIFNLLKQRLDEHAQEEIREYANAIYSIIKPVVPFCCEAFEDYVLNAKTFSKEESDIIKYFFHNSKLDNLLNISLSKSNLSRTEINEFLKKIGKSTNQRP